ncbi:MAG: hypothetical protein HZA20_02195 [Nitrospirae bacterium]|nr:hypothetical protein [Nitrospirota bacterium]
MTGMRGGLAAWALHRITGIALTLYLVGHMYMRSGAYGSDAIAEAMPGSVGKFADMFLLGIVTAHALNGLRVILHDLGTPTRFRNPLMVGAAMTGFALFVLGARSIWWCCG